MNLYNCRECDGGFRITRFDASFNVVEESGRVCSYIVTNATCTCPAGLRGTCKHRKMLGKFLSRNHVGDGWFLNYDNGMWHRSALEDMANIINEAVPGPSEPATFKRRV